MNQLIALPSEQTMTSREIAELVESRHDVVKKSIERLVERGVISQPPMVDGIKSGNGTVEKHYEICKRDSYVIVAQLSPEFTAKLVDRWQELEMKQIAAPAIANPQIAAMMIALQAVDALEQQQAAQAKQLAIHSARMDDIEARNSAVLDGHGFYSILGYANLKGIKLTAPESAKIGKRATAESKSLGIAMGTVPDARYGSVRTYHQDVLDIVFAKEK